METMVTIFVSIVASIGILVILFFVFGRQVLRGFMGQLLQTIVQDNAVQIAEHSKQALQGEKETIAAVMEQKHQAIEKLVERMQRDLETKQAEMRKFEEKRIESFSAMSENLSLQEKAVSQLQLTTNQLTKVLSNNQARGEWGERIIEDLLQANGMVEKIHYSKQTMIPNTQLKPDITLLLPESKYVPVDVKFPYMELQKASVATDKQQQKLHQKNFEADVKKQVNKVAEYIQPEHGTVQYALLFVPNELIFSYINQQYPYLVDHAMQRRVLLVSPFTFLVVARTVMESYRNFMLQDSLKEIYQQLEGFVSEWDKFTGQLTKYGSSIERLQKDFEQLSGTRVRQMQRRIKAIDALHTGVIQKSDLLEESIDD